MNKGIGSKLSDLKTALRQVIIQVVSANGNIVRVVMKIEVWETLSIENQHGAVRRKSEDEGRGNREGRC